LAERFSVRASLAAARARHRVPRRWRRPRRRSSGITGSTQNSPPGFPNQAAGASNASPEVCSPTAHAGCVAVAPRLPAFAEPSRFDVSRVPASRAPARFVLAVFLLFCARAAAPVHPVHRAGAGPGGSCIAGSLQAMFRYPSSRAPVAQPGCHGRARQQRSWGYTLRSFNPGRGWLVTFPCAGPTCRFLRAVRLDGFRRGTGRFGGLTSSPTFAIDSSWTLSARLLGFVPAGQSAVASHRCPQRTAPRQCCPGLGLFQDVRDAVRRVHAGSSPPWTINLRKPLPAPIRSWASRAATDEKWRRINRR
jgi:hypothetical protein